jgi:acyl-CoA synthetase (AMP-forming)/AMP-acid ligase II
MPPQVIRELEEVFGAPLIEAYGMTEATHQMASNPLPPAVRKPGSGGPAAGPRCHHGRGRQLLPRRRDRRDRDPRRERHAGYENNPKANAEASPTAGSAPATRA